MTAFSNARSWSAGALLLAALPVLHAQNYPVTPVQRATAQQVAQQGVPLGELSPTAPDEYMVRRGDTLWGISGMFLRRPWRWPELWGMNLASIANPHLIYPGQVLYLDKSNGYARLRMGARDGSQGLPTVRLSPRVRSESLANMALPTLPAHLIEPFLVQPLVVDAQRLAQAPRIIATTDERVIMASGDRAYVRGSTGLVPQPDSPATRAWRVFRDVRELKDPDNGEILGYEAQYMGQAELVEGETLVSVQDAKGEVRETQVPATIDITDARSEIYAGDRLLPAPARSFSNYVPHAPAGEVDARVVSLYGDTAIRFAAQNQVIAINRGTRDAMAPGQVLQIVTQGDVIQDKTDAERPQVQLPREHNGLAMVFRSFDRVSYALILEVRRPVVVGDHLVTPH
ncbi:LysM peptidoglycan-binding domain-containing protein [Comamonas endophytica]|uniref:LysM peptidoglycan-binding domain-containing protein n=1 Tax=Comamonas endophytica TaxID=2949090 RepID=A0ABY6G5M6_9BURK|nr:MULTISPECIES: LysM domain-containing protein [unclassified Acidovorax]MCD2512335.1 LysM peptidoglycan-binding domain-containing protein [Acidovorax sp. D4N7]UYG50213.1 LysM peptidoglycan-binding domain-containing protein [Acidovorax sp. 5MLIR]